MDRVLLKLPDLQNFFQDFARVSGLHLNIGKTVMVPLATSNTEDLRRLVQSRAHAWRDMVIADAAKYLGFFIGPGRADSSWKAPLEKYLSRAQIWGKIGAGAQLTTEAYRIYIVSVLSFVGQLEEAPSYLREFEAKACRALYPGPMGWISPGCLKELRALHGHNEWVDIQRISDAAKARVLRFENHAHGGLLAVDRGHAIQQAIRDAGCTLGQIAFVSKWFQGSFFDNLLKAHGQQRRVLRDVQERWTAKRSGWQANYSSLLKPLCPQFALMHLRRRLDYWNVRTLQGHRSRRALNMLKTLSEKLPPRVWHAYFRLLCNGWVTGRRFQRSCDCSFGCRHGEDSIQHFASCPVVCNWIHANLGIRRAPVGEELDHFLGLRIENDEATIYNNTYVSRGLAVYALYKVHNGARHNSFGGASLEEVFKYFLQEGQAAEHNL